MVDKDILIEELVERYPSSVGFLMRKGVVCVQCGEPVWGTLEEAARKKGIEGIEALVDELNEFLELSV